MPGVNARRPKMSTGAFKRKKSMATPTTSPEAAPTTRPRTAAIGALIMRDSRMCWQNYYGGLERTGPGQPTSLSKNNSEKTMADFRDGQVNLSP
jgi:hypothetical protein